jgi:NAD(P)-dependent dehydrogenase (short-subunit alcohol dehydrogenase family)
MTPPPEYEDLEYIPSGKLSGKKLLITGGDSGIGRAVVILAAKEGAHVAINYLEEDIDAQETLRLIEDRGGKAFLVKGDIRDPDEVKSIIKRTITSTSSLDILINNAAAQWRTPSIESISPQQLQNIFATNVFGAFYLIQEAKPFFSKDANIITTSSVIAYKGSGRLIDYSSTKGVLLSLLLVPCQSILQKKG